MGANQAISREQPEVRFAGGGVGRGLDAADFTQAFRNHPAGVAVITADAGDGPVALTATSVFSVSVDPPLLVFSLSDQSSSAGSIQRAGSLVVHLLGADQLHLARLCATSGVDRFADRGSWDRLASGEPYFTGVDTWIRGTIVGRMRAGASTVIALHALEARLPDDSAAAPLVYHNRSWHGLGDHSRVGG
ncbi:flavin reductase family protein [Cryobacterium tepidiphilum]|uniref:Flavin reductase n=1 Tax=Cryobacterium tepidiphilum TaxID=2486026 RepID=A0A3M8LMZ1_9MICO|nr:flavin reductase family protein [Cryobacterium tepidiphilum]RNE66715.1 flavin reductase [Cryobacterium tepidiphilum]